MNEFVCMTRVVSGRGSISALKELHLQRLLLVTDPFFARNGTAERVAQAAQAECYEIYDRVEPDPGVTLAAEGAAKVRSFQPDGIVALGGGSAIDCAKAMLYFSGSGACLAAVPTTSGSGSEVTDFAILTHDGVKHPLVDARLRPTMAVLDDGLLTQLPPQLAADGGFDVLAHCLEACAAINASPITDALAHAAFAAAYAGLPASFAGQQSARLPVHLAATMAGMAFTQAGLGLCHAISHSLGGAFHIPHGRLNGILLPWVMDCNTPAASRAYARLARAAGLGGSTDTLAVRNLRGGLIRLRTRLRLPASLVQAGADPALLREKQDALVEAALADPCCRTNPVEPDARCIRQILEAASHG